MCITITSSFSINCSYISHFPQNGIRKQIISIRKYCLLKHRLRLRPWIPCSTTILPNTIPETRQMKNLILLPIIWMMTGIGVILILMTVLVMPRIIWVNVLRILLLLKWWLKPSRIDKFVQLDYLGDSRKVRRSFTHLQLGKLTRGYSMIDAKN